MEERDPNEGLQRGPYTVIVAAAMNASATALAVALSLVRGVLSWRLIDPSQLGIVRGAQLIQIYARYCHVGLIPGLNKTLPIALGRGDRVETDRLEGVGTTAVLALGLLVSLPLLFVALFTDVRIVQASGLTLALAAGLTLVGVTSDLYRAILRAYNQFRIVSVATLGEVVISLPLVVVGAKLLAARGMLGGWFIAMVAAFVYLACASGFRTRLRPDIAQTVGLAAVGLPVLLVALSDQLLTTVDSLLIGHLGGSTDLGLYTPATQFSAYLWQLEGAVIAVLMPRLLTVFGEHGSLQAIRPRVRKANEAFSLLMPVAAGALGLLGPGLVALLLPQFANSMPPLRVLAFGAAIFGVPATAQVQLIAANQESTYVLVRLLGAAVSAVGVLYCLQAGRSLATVAAAQCLGLTVSALALGYAAERCFGPPPRAALRSVRLFAPVVWAALVALGARAASGLVVPAAAAPARSLLETALFGAVMWPLVLIAQRRTGVLTEVLNALPRRASRAGEPPADGGDRPG